MVIAKDAQTSQLNRWFDKFDRHPQLYSFMLVGLYVFINNTINATSDWMEATRETPVQIMLWEPFTWEYSSMLATLTLLPILFAFWRRYPLRFSQPYHQFAVHLLASLLFAIGHVILMVLLREGVYWMAGGNYDFGPWLREFIYEYRKDVWGYIFFLVLFSVFQAIYKRLKGEANLIAEDNTASNNENQIVAAPEHLLVRKLDKEFLVKVADIDWLESSGNYVNLHSDGRIYPLRGTLTELTTKLSNQFTRIHRSRAVNHTAVKHISYQPSGDGEVTLQNGQSLVLSRRYKDGLKQKLSV